MNFVDVWIVHGAGHLISVEWGRGLGWMAAKAASVMAGKIDVSAVKT